ncbi:MAG: hypothetical protein FWC72_01045 [Oscillospiraceae bacterium]|nr:hypothetical protein [Oscillospiraceae bacterium]
MKRIILIALILLTVLGLAACGGPREAISAEEFTARMTKEGHTVEDITHYYEAVDFIETLLIANQGDFDVEFVVYTEADYARRVFSELRNEFERNRGNTSSYSSLSFPNFGRFRQTTAGRFEAVAWVGNTLVLIETTAEHRDAANAVLDLLGY